MIMRLKEGEGMIIYFRLFLEPIRDFALTGAIYQNFLKQYINSDHNLRKLKSFK